MKKLTVLSIFFLLAACLPAPQTQATVAPTVTLTPTAIPTLTPNPTATISPQFIALQEQISQNEMYTLNADGQVEMQTSEGVEIVPEILVSKDGKMTVTHNGETFEADASTVVVDGQKITFNDNEGRKWVFDGDKLLKTHTEDEIKQMTDEEKLANAPETIDGYTRSNVSTVKSELVIYRDAQGNAIKAFNLSTAQELSLPEAGIIELNLIDGNIYETRYFSTAKEAIDFISVSSKLNTAVPLRFLTTVYTTDEAYTFFRVVKKIPGWQPKSTYVLGGTGREGELNSYSSAEINTTQDNIVLIGVANIKQGLFLDFIDVDGNFQGIFIKDNPDITNDAEELMNRLGRGLPIDF